MTSRIVGVPKETAPHERRVALVPDEVQRLVKNGLQVVVAAGAGNGAYFSDADYEAAGARIAPSNEAVVEAADILPAVHPLEMPLLDRLNEGAVLLHMWRSEQTLDADAYLERAARRQASVYALDHIPRTTRAQFLDVLSSQATVAGYKAVLVGAEQSPHLFPMLTTAAGTIRPARVLVIGAGVAGLQAIATARRLGAQVFAYDIRRAAQADAESVGARFLASPVIAEGEGGYARALTDDEKQQVHQFLKGHVAQMDVIITTAQVPGRPAPRIVTEDMIEAMKPGSVIVDMAADSGGNCAFSEPGRTVVHGGVIIVGPVNLPSSAPIAASRLFSKNIFNFLDLMKAADEALAAPADDEILEATCILYRGKPVKEYSHA